MIVCFGEFEFDRKRLQLRREGRAVKAEAVAMRVLDVLVRQSGEVVTKDELIEEVWEGRAVADNVITVAMARLRKALKGERPDEEYVATVYGRGYRFIAPCSVRTAAEPEAPPAQSDRPSGLPFVGRERVLDRLELALADAQRGRGRMCVLIGEAGIGKTRAVEALEQRLRGSSVRVAWGFCREAGDTPPLWPFRRLLRDVAARSGSARADLLERVDEILRPLDSNAPIGDGIEDSPEQRRAARHESFELFAQAFAEAALESPWLLILDDLHRADAASLELLGYLVDEIAHSRILLVATLRHAAGRRSPRPDTYLPYVLGHRNCERIPLERLRAGDVASYVAALVDDSDGSLAHAVFEKSEGNPFFMTELARQLIDMERPQTGELRVPDVALDLIRQRIAKLAPDAREVLAAAAVIGRTFELSLLQAATGRDPSTLMASLDQAIAADLVVAAADSTTAFAFGHDLMRAVLYDSLPASEQRGWHIRTANALEQRADMGEPVPASELAYHLHAALPESDLRKTVAFCRAASAAAASVYAHSDVVRYLLHALEALSLTERPSVRLRTSMWYLIALYSLGRPLSTRALAEVVRLAKEQRSPFMLVRAAVMLNAYPGLKPLTGARAALEEALRVSPPDAPALRAVTLAALACSAPNCCDREQSERLLSEAIALTKDTRSRAARYVTLVTQMYIQGGPAHGDVPQRAADELTELHGPSIEPRMVVAPLYVASFRALHALQRGELNQTMAALDQGLRHGREIRHLLSWHFRRSQALIAINRGAPAESIPTLEMLHRTAEREDLFWTEAFCAFDRIVILPELVESKPLLDDALRAALDYDPSEPPGMWALKVRSLATVGLGAEARAALYAVPPSELGKLPCDIQYLGTLGHLTHAALRLGARDYIEALFPLLAAFPSHFAVGSAFLSDAVPELLARMCMFLGRDREAVLHAETALQMNARAGLMRSFVESQLLLARCLSTHEARSERERGLSLAREAEVAATQLGLRLAARTATSLVEELGTRGAP